MPLRETEAIVLRSYRLGEADKIVSLFTRQMGRLRAVAADARRPKSRFGSTLEPLGYIRLWIFERENRDLLRINSAELVESFFDMQKEYRVQVAAQYVAEVTERFLPEREVNERAFRLVVAVLKSLKRSAEVNRALLYFDYWMLLLAGILPEFEHCLNCGRALGASGGFFGQGSEGLACTDCRPAHARKTVPAAGLAYAASARRQSLDQWIEAGPGPAGSKEARLFLEEVIESHAEKPLATRSLLADEA